MAVSACPRVRLSNDRGVYADQQFIEHDAQRIDVSPGIYVILALDLFGADIFQRTEEALVLGVDRLLGQRQVGGLGDAEIDDLHGCLVAFLRHKDILRFQIPVDDALLVGMANRQTNVVKQFDTGVQAQFLWVSAYSSRVWPGTYSMANQG